MVPTTLMAWCLRRCLPGCGLVSRRDLMLATARFAELAARGTHQCMHGRPAMGSNRTVLRSGRQGPPLPDTGLPQAAGSNSSSNIPLKPSARVT